IIIVRTLLGGGGNKIVELEFDEFAAYPVSLRHRFPASQQIVVQTLPDLKTGLQIRQILDVGVLHTDGFALTLNFNFPVVDAATKIMQTLAETAEVTRQRLKFPVS